MNKKMVLLVIISSLLLLWTFSLLFSAFVNATPEGIVVKGNYLTKQDFGSVTSSLNRQYSFLRGDGEIDFYETDNEILALNTINWLAEDSLADLNITEVYLDPLEPMRGDDVIFYAEVENQGTENANDFVVELYLDAELIANATFSLDAGVKDTYWNTDPWTATSGSHTVRWVVDATNAIAETNEDNNEMSKTFMVEAEGIELYYDDGTAEQGWCWNLPECMFAVRFTPLTSGRLTECSFYISSDPATIMVHVLDTDKNDMITPFPQTPTSTGWFHVDLTAYDIIVSPDVDFYVAMESTVAYAPYLGDDTSGPDGRSWDYNRVNWYQYVDGDYMIRTVIKTVADLNITAVRLEPYPLKPGDYVTFYADVENQGSEDAADFWVVLYLDGEEIASGIDTDGLPAGETCTYSNTDPWEATLGKHTVRWVIDATNVIDELSEDNNEMSKIFIVGYVLTVQTPYSDIEVWIDGERNLTDSDGNFQTIVDEGDHEVQVETPVFLDPGSQGVFVQWDDENSENPRTIPVNNNRSLTAEYKTQYYLTVATTHGTTSGEGWYDEGDTAYATVTPLTVPGLTGVQYVFTYWSEDASGNSSPSDPIIMDGPKTAVANWKTQYLVTFAQTGLDATATGTVVTVNGDTNTFSDLPYTTWVDSDGPISYSYSDLVSSSVEDQRFRLADVSGPTSPITITGPVTITGNYITQYYLTVDSPYGTPGGAGWYDNCTTAYATLDTDAVDHLIGTRGVFMHWSGDASGTDYTTSDPIHMDGPKTATANWKTQHLVTFAQTGLDATATGIVLTVNGDTKTFFSFPNDTWVDDGVSISYSYSDPVSSSTSDKRFSLVDVTGPDSPISVTGPATVTAEYKIQYYLTMSTNFGTVTPGSGWHDAGSTVQIEASALGVADGERYVWLGWTGTGDSSYSSNDNPASITMNGPTAETAAWRHEYYLTVTSSYGSPTPESGWFEAGKSITALVTSPVAGPVVTQYLCTGWTGCVSTSGTTTSVTFTITGPSSITWNWETQQPLSIEVLALFIGVFSVICTVTAFAVNRRKRGRVKTLLDDIDDAYFSFKKNARRCEAELYRLRDIVLEDYKNGRINEQSYDVLNERINDYLSKL